MTRITAGLRISSCFSWKISSVKISSCSCCLQPSFSSPFVSPPFNCGKDKNHDIVVIGTIAHFSLRKNWNFYFFLRAALFNFIAPREHRRNDA